MSALKAINKIKYARYYYKVGYFASRSIYSKRKKKHKFYQKHFLLLAKCIITKVF